MGAPRDRMLRGGRKQRLRHNGSSSDNSVLVAMHRGSSQRWIPVTLISLVLLLSTAGTVAGSVRLDPPEEECEADPAACVFGSFFALLVAPFTYPFSGLRASYHPGNPPGIGGRLERAFRKLRAPHDRTHPFVGVGWHATLHTREGTLTSPPHTDLDGAFEAVLGYQLALDPLLNTSASRFPSAIWTTEVQWLLGSTDGLVRTQMGPGVSFDLSEDRRLRLQVAITLDLAGPQRGRVRPALGVGWSWE